MVGAAMPEKSSNSAPKELFLQMLVQQNHIKNVTQWGFPGKESTYQWRGNRFHPWSRKIPHAEEQLSLSASPQLLSLCSGDWQLHLLNPRAATTEAQEPRPCSLQGEKPSQRDAHTATKTQQNHKWCKTKNVTQKDSARWFLRGTWSGKVSLSHSQSISWALEGPSPKCRG